MIEIKGTEHLRKIGLSLIDPEDVGGWSDEFFNIIKNAIYQDKRRSDPNTYTTLLDEDDFIVLIHNFPRNAEVRKMIPKKRISLYHMMAIPEEEIMALTTITLQKIFAMANISEAILEVSYAPIMNKIIDFAIEHMFHVIKKYYDTETGECIMHVKENFKNILTWSNN